MSILNKFLTTAIALLVIQGVLTQFYPQYSCMIAYTDHSWTIATILALIMMLLNGTVMSTRYFSFAKAGLAILVLGVCFKIMHLSGAEEILALAFLMLFLSYGIHFITKHPKNPLDVFKLLTMLSFLIPTSLQMFHFLSYETKMALETVGFALFWFTFLLFLGTKRKNLWAKKVSTP
jgi:hypothetical protein